MSRLLIFLAAALTASCSSTAANAPPDTTQGEPSGPTLPIPADLWRAPAGSTPTQVSYFYLDADPALTPSTTYPRTIVPTSGAITVSVVGGVLTVTAIESATQLDVRGVFTTMLGHLRLDEGYYHDLRGPADANPLRGSIDVVLGGRHCASATGWFAVDHVFYFNGRLTTLDLRFEQRCADVVAPIHGQIHWTENLT